MKCRIEELNAALNAVKKETGAKCLEELSFHKLNQRSADDIFQVVFGVTTSACVSGAEIDLDDRLKEIVKLRLMYSILEMVELLEDDLHKLGYVKKEEPPFEERRLGSIFG
jgi:hypothetical protein